MVTLTPRASAEVLEMQQNQPEHVGRPLRLYVEQGGCSGMQYGMVFDEARAGDVEMEFGGARVVVDADSAPYLHGTEVDFSDAMTGGGFKIRN
ncbi:MAG TPA: iron-sulfur cluster assembly accessory protein, partial [Verrucomicrobiota bacterium]|nr:iron-sulfur cluster assembly accessory protein [Verrucomicrobiota bacterium]